MSLKDLADNERILYIDKCAQVIGDYICGSDDINVDHLKEAYGAYTSINSTIQREMFFGKDVVENIGKIRQALAQP